MSVAQNNTENAVPDDVADLITFATLSPDNEAALHLLELVRAYSPLPNLRCDEDAVAYHLSLPKSPVDRDSDVPPPLWRIGSGPPPNFPVKKPDDCQADLLLCPPGKSLSSTRARLSIRNLHAKISFHSQSGALMLQSTGHYPMSLIYTEGDADGSDFDLSSSANKMCVLRKRRNRIQIGNYRYILEFTLEPEGYDTFKSQRNDYLLRHYKNTIPSQYLNPIPSERVKTWRNVWLHRKLSQSAHSSLRSGVDLFSGDPVAVKELLCTKETRQSVCHQLRMSRQVSEIGLKEGVVPIIETWCCHGVSPPCVLEDEAKGSRDQVLYYSMPLAEYSFLTLSWRKLGLVDRLAYAYQTLLGLGQLHKRGIVHGNIRPTTLLIFAGSVSSVNSSPDHRLPTRAAISLSMRNADSSEPKASVCVAPEIWATPDKVTYTKKSDIFAIAASWLYGYSSPPDGVKMDVNSYVRLERTLDVQSKLGKFRGPFLDLFRQMLAWDPRDRPSVEEALAHEAWESVLAREESVRESKRRDREERARVPEGNVKRVRILSPEC